MQDREIKDLEHTLEQIWEVARKFGLDPFPTRFELVPATVMYEIGSYALPGRYSHWTFGKAYHRMKTMYDFGLSKIYEVVINTNPAYGFLLETNSPVQKKRAAGPRRNQKRGATTTSGVWASRPRLNRRQSSSRRANRCPKKTSSIISCATRPRSQTGSATSWRWCTKRWNTSSRRCRRR